MKTNPFISAIVPCYNSETTILDALESFYKQNYDHWEVVVVNDGSTDETEKIVRIFCSKDSRFKIFNKTNGGFPSAVNFGLEKINGDYFMILGSDDALVPGFFNKLAKKLNSLEYDLIGFKTIVNENNILKEDCATNVKKIYRYKNTDIIKLEASGCPNFNMCFNRDTSKLYKTSKLNGNRYYGRYGIDSDGVFSTIFCHRANNFLFLPIEGYIWNKRSSSLSAIFNNPKYLNDRLLVWICCFEKLSQIVPFNFCDFDLILLYNAIKLMIYYRKSYLINFKKQRYLHMILKRYVILSKVLNKKGIKIRKIYRIFFRCPLIGVVLTKLVK